MSGNKRNQRESAEIKEIQLESKGITGRNQLGISGYQRE
jgi:hypothetical protein